MIRSTFAGFSMAQHALLVNQRAIDVSGQNLSNMNTVGYTRQRLDLASISPTGLSASTSQNENKVGQGVMMTGVTQIRDPYLDIQYRNQMAKVGTVDATDQILERLGDIFDETDSTAIRAGLNDIITQLKTMATTPNSGNDSFDTVVRSSFEILLNMVHQNDSELDVLTEEVVMKMEDSIVPNINSILNSIGELNQTIKNSEVLGNTALELKDQRNSLIDELAAYLPITVDYDTINQGGMIVNELSITFKDAEGVIHNLVDDEVASELVLGMNGDNFTLNIIDPANPPSADPLNPSNSDKDVADSLINGILKGNLDMLNKSEVYDSTDYKGIGYYESAFDQFVNYMATTMNDLNATQAVDPVTGDLMFEADGITPIMQRNDLFATSDGSGIFTAENTIVSEAWINGTVSLTKTQEQGTGDTENSTAYENILKMVNALNSDVIEFNHTQDPGPPPVVANVFTGTIQEFYDTLQTIQSIERKSSTTLLENHTAVANQIANSRDSVSGVNQDEEVMDLMRYQQSYNAASRLMTTLDELLDKLINQTGVVGR